MRQAQRSGSALRRHVRGQRSTPIIAYDQRHPHQLRRRRRRRRPPLVDFLPRIELGVQRSAMRCRGGVNRMIAERCYHRGCDAQ